MGSFKKVVLNGGFFGPFSKQTFLRIRRFILTLTDSHRNSGSSYCLVPVGKGPYERNVKLGMLELLQVEQHWAETCL